MYQGAEPHYYHGAHGRGYHMTNYAQKPEARSLDPNRGSPHHHHYDGHAGGYQHPHQQHYDHDEHGAFLGGGHDLESIPSRYIYVGENKGHYDHVRGRYHYVGAGQGDYEREVLPPKYTWQRLGLVALCVIVTLVVGIAIAYPIICPPPPAFDCEAGFDNMVAGWSEMKKEYCCENEAVGCEALPNLPGQNEKPSAVPKWLDMWMADMSLGFKFAISASIFLVLGCCCGCQMYLYYLKHYAPKPRSATEQELKAEIMKLLHRLGAKTGELAITLMWDTIDDLDLHVKLPNGLGEISAENKSVAGGTLDIDGNHCLERQTIKPIENIYWPECDDSSKDHPPLGEYSVTVKCYARVQRVRDANLTVVVSMSGKTDIYHHRMVQGISEVKICNFKYTGPPNLHHDSSHRQPGHSGSSSRRGHDNHGRSGGHHH